MSQVHLDLLQALDLSFDLVLLGIHASLESITSLIPDFDTANDLTVLLCVRDPDLVDTVALIRQIHEFVEGEQLSVQDLVRVRIHHSQGERCTLIHNLNQERIFEYECLLVAEIMRLL